MACTGYMQCCAASVPCQALSTAVNMLPNHLQYGNASGATAPGTPFAKKPLIIFRRMTTVPLANSGRSIHIVSICVQCTSAWKLLCMPCSLHQQSVLSLSGLPPKRQPLFLSQSLERLLRLPVPRYLIPNKAESANIPVLKQGCDLS